DEVAGLLRVGEDRLVGGDGLIAVTFVLEKIGDLEHEEEVVRVLLGEAALDLQGFGVVAVVAQEEAERGAGFDGGDDAVLGGVAQKIEAFLLGPADAEHTDHEAKEAWEAGDGELLDSDGMSASAYWGSILSTASLSLRAC